MPHELKAIPIDETSALARLLSEAGTQPLRLTAGGASYRVIREDTLAQADPAAFRAEIDRLAGSWSSEDADAAIKEIAAARQEGSRPATRP